jgi:SAM-dependent methyltransferase
MIADATAPPATAQERMSVDEAVRLLRADPAREDLVRDAYLGRDVADSARRFAVSGEFAEVRRLLGDRLSGAVVLDLGAGTGIASHALLEAGAGRVIAVEPDASDEVGRGAIARLDPGGRIEVLEGFGEEIPVPDGSVDVLYARQVLHHALDLPQLAAECARVLRSGGVLLACREHVVEGPEELASFLAAHPVNQLAGGENAYSLREYLDAIRDAGLDLMQVFGPWDSVINAFPTVRTADELRNHARTALARRFGWLGRLAAMVPGVQALVRRRIQPDDPGRMYTFMAVKRTRS